MIMITLLCFWQELPWRIELVDGTAMTSAKEPLRLENEWRMYTEQWGWVSCPLKLVRRVAPIPTIKTIEKGAEPTYVKTITSTGLQAREKEKPIVVTNKSLAHYSQSHQRQLSDTQDRQQTEMGSGAEKLEQAKKVRIDFIEKRLKVSARVAVLEKKIKHVERQQFLAFDVELRAKLEGLRNGLRDDLQSQKEILNQLRRQEKLARSQALIGD